jgi:hypothetical protein
MNWTSFFFFLFCEKTNFFSCCFGKNISFSSKFFPISSVFFEKKKKSKEIFLKIIFFFFETKIFFFKKKIAHFLLLFLFEILAGRLKKRFFIFGKRGSREEKEKQIKHIFDF